MTKKILSILFITFGAISVNAQTLTLQSNKNEISAAEAGNYDRVEYIRQVQKGTTILASFPAKLDGYYFGPDAERYLVTSLTENTDGTLDIATETMADSLDFMPGKKYIISPTQSLDSIACLTPAKKTEVNKTSEPLVCKVVDNKTAIANITVVSKDINAPIYDLSGKRLSAIGKPGVYIIRNRKILIK